MKQIKFILFFSVVLFLYTSSISWAQSSRLIPVNIQQLMTSTTIEQTGLQKLTPQELKVLNDWLDAYSAYLLSEADGDCPTNSLNECSEIVESNIKGVFGGWGGETVFPLGNGQIWQQSEPGIISDYIRSPKVTIFCLQGEWKMQVESVINPIAVRRLK